MCKILNPKGSCSFIHKTLAQPSWIEPFSADTYGCYISYRLHLYPYILNLFMDNHQLCNPHLSLPVPLSFTTSSGSKLKEYSIPKNSFHFFSVLNGSTMSFPFCYCRIWWFVYSHLHNAVNLTHQPRVFPLFMSKVPDLCCHSL